jgi:8-oxo-dGTP diphosphatase
VIGAPAVTCDDSARDLAPARTISERRGIVSDDGPDRIRSWEPIGDGDLAGLRRLAVAAARVEDDALARLDAAGAGDVGELVVWAWVVDADRRHTLLVDHHRFGVWMAPGGRSEAGEDPLAAASRELLEETGVTGVSTMPSPALIDAVTGSTPEGRPVTTFGLAFTFHADLDAPLSPEAGQPARWWPLTDPPERRHLRMWEWMVEHFARTG